MNYPITNIEGINSATADVLRSMGIRTTSKLLEAAKAPKGRKALAAKTGRSEKALLRWANSADRMRINGLGPDYSVLLEACGVDTVRELRYRKPENLARRIAEINAKRKLVEFLPPQKLIVRWVEHAKKLPLKISYKGKNGD